MIFWGRGVIGSLIIGLLLLYAASLPGPWFTNDEATEIVPSWVIRVIMFLAALWFFYISLWRLMHRRLF